MSNDEHQHHHKRPHNRQHQRSADQQTASDPHGDQEDAHNNGYCLDQVHPELIYCCCDRVRLVGHMSYINTHGKLFLEFIKALLNRITHHHDISSGNS